ncbi:hypothetical protein G7Y79_00017g043210 [Physcia stellaris]|nr:hypothetical protein G7Y79_00017g043210 [Physcia stellaris]
MAPQRHGKRHTATNALVPYDKSGSQSSQRQNDNEGSTRSFDGASMVTLLVGEKENPFHVHMEMICNESAFFKSAFMGAGQFEETAQKSMKLPEDDPETIDRMIQWIYFKTYPYDRKAAREGHQDAQSALWQLAYLYVAADKYGIIALKNDIMHLLYGIAGLNKTIPQDEAVQYVYNNTDSGSNLRRLMAEWHVWFVESRWLKHEIDGAFVHENSEFAADLITGMAAKLYGGTSPWTDSPINFLKI